MPEIVAPVSRVYAAGDTLSIKHTITDNDGDAQDITGWTFRFALSRTVGGTTVLGTELSPATATVTLTTPASGIMHIGITKTDTASLTGTYYFETEGQDGAGEESTVARGYMTFKPTQI